MRLGTVLVVLSLLTAMAQAQSAPAPVQRVAGTAAQVLAAFRGETVEGVLFLGVPGDEALWAQVLPYLAEGRAVGFTPVCPRSRPKGARLFKLPNPGTGLLFLLRTRTATVLATGTPERVEGVIADVSAYGSLKRQLNLEAFDENAERMFPYCP